VSIAASGSADDASAHSGPAARGQPHVARPDEEADPYAIADSAREPYAQPWRQQLTPKQEQQRARQEAVFTTMRAKQEEQGWERRVWHQWLAVNGDEGSRGVARSPREKTLLRDLLVNRAVYERVSDYQVSGNSDMDWHSWKAPNELEGEKLAAVKRILEASRAILPNSGYSYAQLSEHAAELMPYAECGTFDRMLLEWADWWSANHGGKDVPAEEVAAMLRVQDFWSNCPQIKTHGGVRFDGYTRSLVLAFNCKIGWNPAGKEPFSGSPSPAGRPRVSQVQRCARWR
jgi:hypothetical protein